MVHYPGVLASVIVPARDAAATLSRTLEALSAQRIDGEYEVIVVDDGSTDATAAIAARMGARVISAARGGPAAARNAGAAAARGRALAFCDADVFVAPGWLAAGVAALHEDDLVQGLVLPDPTVPLGPFDRTIWVTAAIGLFEAASLFVRREVFDAVGGFEDWLDPGRGGKALAEDVWFGWRVRRAGYRTGFCASAQAHHAVFARSWRAYVQERARVRFFPAMVERMPELRSAFLRGHLFLNGRSARLDLALAGGLAAAVTCSPLPLVASGPYTRRVWRDARRGGGFRAGVAAADVAADLVGAAALAYGSLRWRSPVL